MVVVGFFKLCNCFVFFCFSLCDDGRAGASEGREAKRKKTGDAFWDAFACGCGRSGGAYVGYRCRATGNGMVSAAAALILISSVVREWEHPA